MGRHEEQQFKKSLLLTRSSFFPFLLSYTDKQETEKKIVSQIFIKDDKAFLTGDLMFSDEENFLYFADRVGDTFRWKGGRTLWMVFLVCLFANFSF